MEATHIYFKYSCGTYTPFQFYLRDIFSFLVFCPPQGSPYLRSEGIPKQHGKWHSTTQSFPRLMLEMLNWHFPWLSGKVCSFRMPSFYTSHSLQTIHSFTHTLRFNHLWSRLPWPTVLKTRTGAWRRQCRMTRAPLGSGLLKCPCRLFVLGTVFILPHPPFLIRRIANFLFIFIYLFIILSFSLLVFIGLGPPLITRVPF